MAAALDAWRRRYEGLGLATVPLFAGSKRPVCEDWQATPPSVQWREAGGRAGNIGLRTGNGFAVADADAPQTVDALRRVWQGWGVSVPIPTVATPSGGRHFYLKVTGIPDGMSYSHWRADIGPGELRVGPGAQVVGPCSAVDGRRYRFLPGTSPEDWLRLHPLHWRDLSKLVRPQHVVPLDRLPIPLPRRKLAEWAEWLLGALAHHPPGMPVRVARDGTVVQYASRSEAEQAVILHAVGRGWSFEDVAALFEQRQPAHYAAQRDRERYLRLCWRKALGYFAGTAERQTLAELWRWAEARPWPGRGGAGEYLAYRALLQRGWLANTLMPNVSRRDVELSASMGGQGARGALRRLVAQGLIARTGQRQRAADAQAWELLPVDVTLGIAEPAREFDALPGGAELWTVLGRAAGMVYTRLTHESQSVAALAEATGKHRSTVYRAADTLVRYGLAADVGAGWVLGERSADDVARELGVATAKRTRERLIAHERETFREMLLSADVRTGPSYGGRG